MLEYAAPLQRLAVSRTLWLVVAWPIVGLAWQLMVARPRIERSREAGAVLRELGRARVAGIGSITLAATAAAGHALLFLRLPAGRRALLQSVAPRPRFGGIDAGLDLLLDGQALAVCAMACGVALAAAGLLATRPAAERGWRSWAWLQLALAAALVSLLADGFVVVAMGWSLTAVAGAWLAGRHDAGAAMLVATRSAVAQGAMLAAAALLFWGMNGTWDAEGYSPDAGPPFVAVRVGAGTGTGDAFLTMTSLPGARVFVDEALTSELRAPFARAPLPSGSHSLRVHVDEGGDDAVLGRIEARPGEEVALVPLGPTLSFHTMADVVAVQRRPTGGALGAIEERTAPGGLPVIQSALLVLLAAAAAMAPRMRVVPGALGGVAAAVMSAVGPFLLARFAFLFPLAGHAQAAVTGLGAVLFLWALWQALEHAGARRWLAFAGSAPPGLSLVALGVGGVGQGVPVIVGAGVAAAATHLVVALRTGEGGGVDEGAASAVKMPAPKGVEYALLVLVPARLGDLLASMERWVVGAVADAFAGATAAAAWAVAMVDEHVVTSPADLAAVRLRRAARALEPMCGVSAARLVWGVLALAAAAALVHVIWPGG
jgi:hypothetical protein